MGKFSVLNVLPLDGKSSVWYDTVLFPSPGYVKILLEFLIQHNSTTELNKKVSFHAVSYSRLLVMISSSLISCMCNVSLEMHFCWSTLGSIFKWIPIFIFIGIVQLKHCCKRHYVLFCTVYISILLWQRDLKCRYWVGLSNK